MTPNNFRKYWIPAAENLLSLLEPHMLNTNSLYNSSINNTFSRLMNLDLYFEEYVNTPLEKDKEMSDEMKNLMLGLAGPHALTIYKAYRIRKDLDVKKENSI